MAIEDVVKATIPSKKVKGTGKSQDDTDFLWAVAHHEAEPWVDLKTVARHIGFSYQTALKMVQRGEIPCIPLANGARVHRRFQLSTVDAALRKNGV